MEDESDAAVIAASLDRPCGSGRSSTGTRRCCIAISCAGSVRTRPRAWWARSSESRSRSADVRPAAADRAPVALRHRHQPAGEASTPRGASHPRGGAARRASGPAGRSRRRSERRRRRGRLVAACRRGGHGAAGTRNATRSSCTCGRASATRRSRTRSACPIGTVRSRLNRARGRLRELAGSSGREEDDNIESRDPGRIGS